MFYGTEQINNYIVDDGSEVSYCWRNKKGDAGIHPVGLGLNQKSQCEFK